MFLGFTIAATIRANNNHNTLESFPLALSKLSELEDICASGVAHEFVIVGEDSVALLEFMFNVGRNLHIQVTRGLPQVT